MKKSYFALCALLLALCVGLAGCGDKPQDETADTTGTTAESTTKRETTTKKEATEKPATAKATTTKPTTTEATTTTKPTTTKPTTTQEPTTQSPAVQAAVQGERAKLPMMESQFNNKVTAQVSAKGSMLVYTFTFKEQEEDAAAVKADLDATLDGQKANEKLMLGSLRDAYGVKDLSVQYVFKSKDGKVITSKTFQ